MTIQESLFLGALQGLTEFLPISSSGHLVIAQHFLPDIAFDGAVFESFLHLGTLLAVLVYFRVEMLKKSINYWILIATATIPAVFVGLFFQDAIESLFSSVKFVGYSLIISGIINYLTDKQRPVKDMKENSKWALCVGIAQSIAIVPGISRSGSTIFAGTKLGMPKKKAAEFSFLLSIPAIMGANVLQLFKYGVATNTSYFVMAGGFISAFIFGLVAIGFLMQLLVKNKLRFFAGYCVILGIFVIVLI